MDIITQANWIDILILILLFKISYIGFIRGASLELFPLLGTYITMVVAYHFYRPLGNFVSSVIPIPAIYLMSISFAAIAIVLRLIYNMTLQHSSKTMNGQASSLFGKIGGLALGSARATLMVFIILTLLRAMPITYINTSVNEGSFLAGDISKPGEAVYTKTIKLFQRLRGGKN